MITDISFFWGIYMMYFGAFLNPGGGGDVSGTNVFRPVHTADLTKLLHNRFFTLLNRVELELLLCMWVYEAGIIQVYYLFYYRYKLAFDLLANQ